MGRWQPCSALGIVSAYLHSTHSSQELEDREAIFQARASEPAVSKDQDISLQAFVSTPNSTARLKDM